MVTKKVHQLLTFVMLYPIQTLVLLLGLEDVFQQSKTSNCKVRIYLQTKTSELKDADHQTSVKRQRCLPSRCGGMNIFLFFFKTKVITLGCEAVCDHQNYAGGPRHGWRCKIFRQSGQGSVFMIFAYAEYLIWRKEAMEKSRSKGRVPEKKRKKV